MSVPRKKIFHFNVYNVNSQHYHKKGQNNTEYKLHHRKILTSHLTPISCIGK